MLSTIGGQANARLAVAIVLTTSMTWGIIQTCNCTTFCKICLILRSKGLDYSNHDNANRVYSERSDSPKDRRPYQSYEQQDLVPKASRHSSRHRRISDKQTHPLEIMWSYTTPTKEHGDQHRHPLTAVSVASAVVSAVWATPCEAPPPPRTARHLLTPVLLCGVQVGLESRSAAPARGNMPWPIKRSSERSQICELGLRSNATVRCRDFTCSPGTSLEQHHALVVGGTFEVLS